MVATNSTLYVQERCNRRWTHSPLPVTTSVSPSAPKRLKWWTNPPQESHTRNETSQWRVRGSRRWRTSPTLVVSRSANIDAEVNNRITKASSAFGRLKKTVWERRGISQRNKIKVCRAVVLTILLYGCETWAIYRRYEKQLQQFHLWCLCGIFKICWQDKIPNTEVLERAELPSVITTIRKQGCGVGVGRIFNLRSRSRRKF